MPLIRCPACSRKLNAPDTVVGKQLRCPLCKHVFRVPGEPAAVAPLEVVKEAPPPRPPARPPAPAPRPPRPDVAEAYTDEDRPARRRRPEEADYADEPAARGTDRGRARRAARGGVSGLQMAFV